MDSAQFRRASIDFREVTIPMTWRSVEGAHSINVYCNRVYDVVPNERKHQSAQKKSVPFSVARADFHYSQFPKHTNSRGNKTNRNPPHSVSFHIKTFRQWPTPRNTRLPTTAVVVKMEAPATLLGLHFEVTRHPRSYWRKTNSFDTVVTASLPLCW